MEGWIKLHRKIIDNPYYFSEPFTRSQAWVDLLLIANNKPGMFYKRGIRVEVERGQVGYDIETLAHRWKWSRGKVERFISGLEKDSQIVRQKNNVTTLISICNYNIYQSDSKADNKASSKANGHQTDTNKKEKKDKEVDTIVSTWRDNFEIYLKECKAEYSRLYRDQSFIDEQSRLNPNVNIKLSIEKGYTNFWGTELGWKHKKKSKSASIDWKSTIINSIEMNKVYYTREELASL